MGSSQQHGFTLAETFITFILIVVTTSIAIPTYHSYQRRQYFQHIMHAIIPYQHRIEKCYEKLGSFVNCNAGENNIPSPLTANNISTIENLNVTDGKIIVTPKPKYGIAQKSIYVLTPEIIHGNIVWAPSGNSVEEGYAH